MTALEEDKRYIREQLFRLNVIVKSTCFLCLIPTPLMLLGRTELSIVSALLFLAYVACKRNYFEPTAQDVHNRLFGKASSGLRTTGLRVNGQSHGQFVLTDPNGQAAQDSLYGNLVHGEGSTEHIMTPDAALYGQIQWQSKF